MCPSANILQYNIIYLPDRHYTVCVRQCKLSSKIIHWMYSDRWKTWSTATAQINIWNTCVKNIIQSWWVSSRKIGEYRLFCLLVHLPSLSPNKVKMNRHLPGEETLKYQRLNNNNNNNNDNGMLLAIVWQFKHMNVVMKWSRPSYHHNEPNQNHPKPHSLSSQTK